MEAEESKLTEGFGEAGRQAKIPKGVGPLSFEVLRREIGDWSGFNNYPERVQALRRGFAGVHAAAIPQPSISNMNP